MDWLSIDDAIEWIKNRLMTKDPKFVLDNWDHKYINVRIDMRTGNCLIMEGNILKEK